MNFNTSMLEWGSGAGDINMTDWVCVPRARSSPPAVGSQSASAGGGEGTERGLGPPTIQLLSYSDGQTKSWSETIDNLSSPAATYCSVCSVASPHSHHQTCKSIPTEEWRWQNSNELGNRTYFDIQLGILSKYEAYIYKNYPECCVLCVEMEGWGLEGGGAGGVCVCYWW